MYDILYVTSFTDKMYQATGRPMLKTWLRTQPEGHFYATYEGFKKIDPLLEHERITAYNLEEDEWLASWLKEHEDVIPQQYGGKLDTSVEPKDIPEKFRRHAARWFRKIVTIANALPLVKDVLITVDSDCVFLRTFPESFLRGICKDVAVVHHTGKYRIERDLGVEAGFTVFNMNEGGREFLEEVVDVFRSGTFRSLLRWDDSYVLSYILQQERYKHKDVVPVHRVKYGGHVVREGPFRKYVEHHKGSHNKKHKLIVGF